MKRIAIAVMLWLALAAVATAEHFTLGIVPDDVWSASSALATFALVMWCYK